MKLSVVFPSIRPHLWPQCLNSVLQNSIEVEFIIVGPPLKKSTPELPTTAVRYITTNARPATCWEMGTRAANNELLCLTCDDFTYTPGFFDAVHRLAVMRRNPYDSFSARYLNNNEEQIAGQMMFGRTSMPLLPVGGVAYTEDHHKIGGVDKEFSGSFWDTDLFTRFFVQGGRTTLLCGHRTDEVGKESNLLSRNADHDYAVFHMLWFRGKSETFDRSRPVASYTQPELDALIIK